MGAACANKKQSETIKTSSYVLQNLEPFPWIRFELTTQKISRIDCQCLMLFTDKKLKIEKNNYLTNVSKKMAIKLQEFFDSAMKGSPLTPGKFIVFDVYFPELGFNKVCVLCLDVWGGKMKIQQPLEACLVVTLRELKKKKITHLSITSFNQEYGIPIDAANKCLVNSIAKESEGMKKIILLCETFEDTSEVKEILEGQSAIKNIGETAEESAYY